MCDYIAYDVSCNTKKLKGLVGMARMLWKDRIGEEKIITGYNVDITIKFVDYVDGKIVVVESLNHNTYTVSKDVWKRGVFSEIIKDLCSTSPKEKKSKTTKAPRVSKYVGQRKKINDVEFYVISYAKNKVEVGAKGYKGSKPMCTSTWTNGKFYKNIMKVLVRIYELIVYNEYPKDFLGRIVVERGDDITHEFEMCDTKEQVRKLFKRYAKYTHPDMGNTLVADKSGFEWLCSLRDCAYEFIEFMDGCLEDDED